MLPAYGLLIGDICRTEGERALKAAVGSRNGSTMAKSKLDHLRWCSNAGTPGKDAMKRK